MLLSLVTSAFICVHLWIKVLTT